jgi:NAD(P)-dependent dehydrogenase (short-subunit alcohol dehydrogenase family)
MGDGKVVVITGAGSGLGRATAQLLLSLGHQVVLVGRNKAHLEETADGSPGSMVCCADVTSADAVRDVFGEIATRAGRIDVLFNNAGVFGPLARIDELEDADWHSTLAVNVSGAVYCAREAARAMLRQRPGGGRIINNGSLSAHRPRPRSLAYTVTKHAISGLTASMQLDLRDQGIAVTQLDVGNSATAMTQGIQVEALQTDGRLVAEPTIEPKYVAQTVAYLVELPLEVAVPTITVMARGMPYAGRG